MPEEGTSGHSQQRITLPTARAHRAQWLMCGMMGIEETQTAQVVGHYLLRSLLGEGSAGQVWLAHDQMLDREVAVKVFRATGADRERILKAFMHEARFAAKLNHQNCLTIYEVGTQGDQAFIAMEYVEGGSLAQELRETGPMPWRAATQAIREAAAGLQAAHSRGVIHRDVKPSNLMRSASGLVKVVDFGLAKAAGADTQRTQTQQGYIIGSPAYMSPEQCRGEPADVRSDVYSLTCTYYQLLMGKPPFAAEDTPAVMYCHVHEPFPRVDGKVSRVPDAVHRIIAKGSQKDPAKRYQSAAELISQLDVVLASPHASHTFDAVQTGGLPGAIRPPIPKPSAIVSRLLRQGTFGKDLRDEEAKAAAARRLVSINLAANAANPSDDFRPLHSTASPLISVLKGQGIWGKVAWLVIALGAAALVLYSLR